jgi:DNA end-binding protein Ku
VNIPIELHTAVRNHRPKFRMLHAKDKSPVKFERVCIRDGHTVAWEDLVKGYRVRQGSTSSSSRRKIFRRPRSRRRDRRHHRLRQGEEIDDRFLRDAVLPGATKGGERAYALLREAIRDSGRIGIAKFILRDAQHPCGRRR